MKLWIFILKSFLLVLSVFGTMDKSHPEASSQAQTNQEKTETAIPNTIATGTIASDDIVYELLKRAKKPERQIAVSALWGNPQYSHFEEAPPYVKERIGDHIESIVRLKPDLIILASYNRPDLVRQLRKSGIPVLLQNHFTEIESIFDNIREIGDHINCQKEARALIQESQKTLDTLKKHPLKKKDASPLTYVNYSPYGYFFGENTSFNSLIKALGGINLIAQKNLTGWVRINDEALVLLNPDYIIASYQPNQNQEEILKEMRLTFWSQLPAVKDKRIIFIPEKDLLSVSHRIIGTLESLHEKILSRPSL